MGVGDQEMCVVLGQFRAAAGREGEVAATLARYVVLSRGHGGSLNIDLLESPTDPSLFVVVQKWASDEDRDSHFDSVDAVRMAEGLRGLLTEKPDIAPFSPISAYDLM